MVPQSPVRLTYFYQSFLLCVYAINTPSVAGPGLPSVPGPGLPSVPTSAVDTPGLMNSPVGNL